ncbi:arginase family-domain-containing protein [Coniochaeta sp. 2T2.1]|nr:arginase family-domain-containing protein [Coniochaeta sp. 2T2.1]
MIYHLLSLALATLLVAPLPASCAQSPDGSTETRPNQGTLSEKWAADRGFSGIVTFAHLPHKACLATEGLGFDIAILGAPFDTATSYRPGARFGPRAVRDASMRLSAGGGYNTRASHNPLASWAKIVDCGDIPVAPYDNALAMRQITEAYVELGKRPATRSVASGSGSRTTSNPIIVTIGGDHSISLPILRAMKEVHKTPVSVLHFDAHMDTWAPDTEAYWDTEQSRFNHGSVFWHASQEGLIDKRSSLHVGLRSRLGGEDDTDYKTDDQQGFTRIANDDIDTIGTKGIISTINAWIGLSKPVYLSVDIDVLDPSQAPGTGTPEVGGWTSRELIQVLRGIEGLNIVGADLVEMSPPYDSTGQVTALAASHIVYEILTSISKRGLLQAEEGDLRRNEL